jgi:hypothetical protein
VKEVVVISTRFLLKDLVTDATTGSMTPFSLKALLILFRTNIAEKGRSLTVSGLIKISLLAFRLVKFFALGFSFS